MDNNKFFSAITIITILVLLLGVLNMAGIKLIQTAHADAPVKFNQEKFNWTASEGAPSNYPMEIIAGNLSSPDGSSLYVPNGATLYYKDWGDGHSTHIGGPALKSLPNQLSLSFFSYTENQFYGGNFELPYQKILALFQAGHYSPKDEADITYHKIIVGVAPGGTVSVWLASLDRTVEVFFGYAEKEEGNWKSIVDNPNITRKDFIQMEITDSLKPDVIKDIKQNGIPFGRWEKYHKARYPWRPMSSNMQFEDNRISYIHFYNGERDFIDLASAKTNNLETRAIPDKLYFVWMRPDEKPLYLKVYFNEKDIFSAFERLGKDNQPLTMDIHAKTQKDGRHLVVTLKNDTESIDLAYTFKTYAVPEPED